MSTVNKNKNIERGMQIISTSKNESFLYSLIICAVFVAFYLYIPHSFPL
jgi:hypothetical protein